jgi:hypothetical protein
MAKKQKPKIDHTKCELQLGPGKGPHVAKLVCIAHNKFVAWVAKRDLNKVKEIVHE